MNGATTTTPIVFQTTRLPTNPFSTRFTRPGTVPPLDPTGRPVAIEPLVDRLLAGPAAMSITAPHGHGKTSLLVALFQELRRRGTPTILVRVRSLRDAWTATVAAARAAPGTVLGIDGCDRLPRSANRVVAAVARRRRLRLVITTHREGGLPVLLRCETSPALLAALVTRLPDHGGRITTGDIDDAFRRHSGDVREAFYDLYDRFERRIR